jgi:signal transduction histidine kinase
MTLFNYIKDRLLILILHLTAMILLSGFLLATANPAQNLILILSSWIFLLVSISGLDFYQRKKYFANIESLLDTIDQKYLLGEVMTPTHHLEDQLYRNIILKSNKSVIEKINQVERNRQEYKEYIETWVHEIKQPITTMHLICENHPSKISPKLRSQLSRIDNYIDTVLFYARSDEVYKDYIIKPTNLEQIVLSVMNKNKSYFREQNVNAELLIHEKTVSTDEKWIQFIINQILQNSVKYKQSDALHLNISTIAAPKSVHLVIEDDGIGIKAHDIDRIFDKGFTGSNGRSGPPAQHSNLEKSTGIGLYLCKKLCDKLHLGIEVTSQEMAFTKVTLIFPDSSYLTKL